MFPLSWRQKGDLKMTWLRVENKNGILICSARLIKAEINVESDDWRLIVE